MSEYRYYEFQAIDRPLGEADMEALRTLSTRAQITATSFTNHYKWGDFKGDPNRLIGRSRLDPFRRGCDLAEVVELGEYLVLDCYSAPKFGSVAISMLSVAYARQMPANGGQIDGLKAPQRQMQGCADLDVLSVCLVATVRSRRHRV